MARKTNTVSAVQKDSDLFAQVRESMDCLGTDALILQSRVGRTTIYRYKRGEAVPATMERKILDAIDELLDGKPKSRIEAAKRAVRTAKPV